MQDNATDFAKAYRTSRLGFFLLASGLVVVCAVDVPALICRLMGQATLIQFWTWMRESGVSRLVSAAAPWTTLAGSALLWAAWDSPRWRRLAGVLMTMCLFDVGSWFLDLGDPDARRPDAYLRYQIGAALGWAQFALLATLSGEMLTHLGEEAANDTAKSTRSLAATGAVLWLLLFFETTDLRAGWPLRPNMWMSPHGYLLRVASDVIHAICLLQATGLVVAAFARLHREVPRAEEEEAGPVDPREFDDMPR